MPGLQLQILARQRVAVQPAAAKLKADAFALNVEFQRHSQPRRSNSYFIKAAISYSHTPGFTAFMAAKDGHWQAGRRALGLAENGVDYSLDEYNRSILTPAMEKRLNQAKADIISGKIVVPEYKE